MHERRTDVVIVTRQSVLLLFLDSTFKTYIVYVTTCTIDKIGQSDGLLSNYRSR